MDWQPMETAPKDGTEFIVYREDVGGFNMSLGQISPCPFCGGAGKPVHQRWSGRDFHGISCDGDCLTFFDCRAASEAEAIAAWNTRALVSPPPGRGGDAVSEPAPWGFDGIIMRRPASYRRPAGTVICSLRAGMAYASQGYVIDWKATQENFLTIADQALSSGEPTSRVGQGANNEADR